MEASNKQDLKSEERRKFVRAMRGLEPGDVITHLCGLIYPEGKILVLGHGPDKDELLFSEISVMLNITLSGLNPFRWDEEQERWVDRKGGVATHIGPGVEVHKGEGRRELALFHALPDPEEAAGYPDAAARLMGEVKDLVLLTDAVLENRAYGDDTVAMMAAVRHALGGNTCPLGEEQLARVALVSYIAQCNAKLKQRMEEIAAATRFFGSVMGADGELQHPGTQQERG